MININYSQVILSNIIYGLIIFLFGFIIVHFVREDNYFIGSLDQYFWLEYYL